MSLRCMNYGCLKKYEESDNSQDSCQHHSQQPIVQDTLKTWPCCGQKSPDFDEFVKMAGCCTGFHSSLPRQPPKVEETPQVAQPDKFLPQLEQSVIRPSTNGQMVPLPLTVEKSVHSALSKLPPSTSAVPDPNCLNIGCLIKQSESASRPTCVHHESEPYFHDLAQVWPCCKKRAEDMTEFLRIGGCVEGEHLWPKNPNLTACNVDFIDEMEWVTVVVYARATDPERLGVRANGGRLWVEATFGGGKYFEKEIGLFGTVEPGLSSVTVSGTNIMVRLAKEQKVAWDRLEL